jgi:hypothetical protein
MVALDQERQAFAAKTSDRNVYSVRRSLAIIAGLSLSFWGVVAIVIYHTL